MTIPPSPPPVAFRLKRPYSSEDEFITGDGHGIFKGGMVLIGAGPRTTGVIVRFEVALRDGTALFRGEGKIIQHRTVAEGPRPAGLEVRFSRLDAKGKVIVDRVMRARAEATANPPSAIPDLNPPPPAASSGPVKVEEGPITGQTPEVDDNALTRSLPSVAPVAMAPEPTGSAPQVPGEGDDGPPTEPPSVDAEPTIMAAAVADVEATVMAPPVVEVADHGRAGDVAEEVADQEATAIAPPVVEVEEATGILPAVALEEATAILPAVAIDEVTGIVPAVGLDEATGVVPAVAEATAISPPVLVDAGAASASSHVAAPDREGALGRLRSRSREPVARPPGRDDALSRLRQRARP